MRIHCLNHVPFERPGAIRSWAENRGHLLTETRVFAADKWPDLNDIDWLVVMGGPMSVHDEAELPWLVTEKRFIEHAIEAQLTVFGVCLGAQLIADVLGARVSRGPYAEIGWFPVELTRPAQDHALTTGLDSQFDVFHWHRDMFDLPAGAVRLARSAGCENQWFSIEERIIGMQFHMEMTPKIARELIEKSGDVLGVERYTQDVETIMATEEKFAVLNRSLMRVLDRLAGSAATRVRSA